MLAQQHRMRTSVQFSAATRSGARSGRRNVVVYAHPCAPQEPTLVGFIVSKAVGNAVVRNRVKRRLRAQVAPLLATVPPGTDLVLRANPAAAGAASREIGEALARALETLIVQLGPVGATR